MILCCIFVSFCVTVLEGRVTHELIHIINSAPGGASVTTLTLFSCKVIKPYECMQLWRV